MIGVSVRRALSSFSRELAAWRAERAAVGGRAATQRRLREHAGVNELEARTSAAFEAARSDLWQAQAEAAERAGDLARRIEVLEAHSQIPVVMDWVRRARLKTNPLISVIMPTRNRSAILGQAIDSVLAQSHDAWELIVVDDGSDDATPGLLATIEDPRIRTVQLDGRGVTAARNAGLGVAKGSVIAYLDDDNLMHEQWLRTVVWAFELRPRTEVVYGAFVIDDPERVDGRGAGGLADVVFRPFDRSRLSGQNPADVSAVAHLAGLAEARFDEDLSMYGDWELLARLTKENDPFAVPAIACFYATDAPGRLSAQAVDPVEHEAVLRALADSDPA